MYKYIYNNVYITQQAQTQMQYANAGGGGGDSRGTRAWIGPGHEITAGFYNENRNLCFMNAVLQCLLRSPHMDKVLETAMRRLASFYILSLPCLSLMHCRFRLFMFIYVLFY